MTAVTVEASLVDGGAQTFTFGSEFLVKLRQLEAAGLTGRALINELITDDWSAPPRGIRITAAGVDRWIPYD